MLFWKKYEDPPPFSSSFVFFMPIVGITLHYVNEALQF